MRSLSKHGSYGSLIKSIGALLEQGRRQAVVAVNHVIIRTYWEIGKLIVEHELAGKIEVGKSVSIAGIPRFRTVICTLLKPLEKVRGVDRQEKLKSFLGGSRD